MGGPPPPPMMGGPPPPPGMGGPPPPGMGGPPPPPGMGGPPPPMGMMMAPRIPAMKKYNPKEKMKRLQWAKINDNQITDDCLWKNLKDEKFHNDALTQDLEALFSMKAPKKDTLRFELDCLRAETKKQSLIFIFLVFFQAVNKQSHKSASVEKIFCFWACDCVQKQELALGDKGV